jgi:hypothetical protein
MLGLGQNARCLSVWGQKKPAGIKLQYFCQYGDKKKITNQRTKLISIYILDTIESESTIGFKNRSSDRKMTSDCLVDVSDDRCTTNRYKYYYFSYITLILLFMSFISQQSIKFHHVILWIFQNSVSKIIIIKLKYLKYKIIK